MVAPWPKVCLQKACAQAREYKYLVAGSVWYLRREEDSKKIDSRPPNSPHQEPDFMSQCVIRLQLSL